MGDVLPPPHFFEKGLMDFKKLQSETAALLESKRKALTRAIAQAQKVGF